MKNAVILGTDPRYLLLGELLAKEGFSLYTEPSPHIRPALFVFPFNEGEDAILSALKDAPRGSLAAVGRAGERLKKFCQARGITLLPFLETEEYLLQNAKETAQGLLGALLSRIPCLISEMTVLVTGYGHCGKEICRLLWLCGAEIWVYSNPRSAERAEKDGWNLFPLNKKGLAMFDAVVNTVTSPLFDQKLLSTLREDTPLFQIASGRAGFWEDTFRDPRIVPLPALPGKCTPQSESELLFRLIKTKLKESEEVL